MQKKAHLTLKRTPKDTPHVKVGDKVKQGETVITVPKAKIHEFDIAKLLGIKPKSLSDCLLVRDGEMVEKAQAIAGKKGLLSKQVIKTPISGEFKIIDADKGIVGIAESSDARDIIAWCSGTVIEVTDEKVVLEVSGHAIVGKEGKGVPTSGMLLVVPEVIDAFALPTELEDRILVVHSASADMLAKADALGVMAVIGTVLDQPPFSLPFVVIESIEPFLKLSGKNAIIYGDEKQILVIEEKDTKGDKK